MSGMLFQAGEVVNMTGLTHHQLREWAGRRAILTPDVPGRGRGKHALYSASTVLVLRLLLEMHEQFKMEVGSWSMLAQRLRDDLIGRPFIALYGRGVAIKDFVTYELIDMSKIRPASTILILPLDIHLTAISEASGAQEQLLQLPLPLFQALPA